MEEAAAANGAPIEAIVLRMIISMAADYGIAFIRPAAMRTR